MTQKLTNNMLSSLASSKLTGTLPALDGSSLTGFSATTKSASDPTTSTNPSGGVGTVWANTTSGSVFICTDATAGSNVWKNIGDGEGGVAPAWDLTRASLDNISYTPHVGNPMNIFWSEDGSYLFNMSESNNRIYRYSATTPYDLTTVSASVDNEYQLPTPVGADGAHAHINSTGTRMLFCGWLPPRVIDYTMSTPWDLSTASQTSQITEGDPFAGVSGWTGTTMESAIWNRDGTKLYLAKRYETVYQYTLSTPFQVSTASYDNKKLDVLDPDFGSNTTFKDSLEGIFFRRDGLMFFHTGKQNDKVHSWTLTTAWDISTATFTSTFDTSGVDATMTFVSVHPDGNKLYFGGHGSDKIHQASM